MFCERKKLVEMNLVKRFNDKNQNDISNYKHIIKNFSNIQSKTV